MEVFEHGPELDILHGAFISAQQAISQTSSDSVLSFSNLKDQDIDAVASIIDESIRNARSTYGKKSPLEEKAVLRKIHAALFFKVLRGCRISCRSADEYYEVLDDYLLDLDWKLYMRIVSQSPLSRHLIECLLQLPENIAFTLLKWTMDAIHIQGDRYLNLLNPVLHSLSHLLFQFHQHKGESSKCDSFQFDFQLAENCENLIENDRISPSVKEFSMQVLKFLQTVQEKTGLMEMLLDWMVALIDGFCEKEQICQFLNESQEFASFCSFFEEYFSQAATLELLQNSLNSFSLEEFKTTALSSDHFNAHPGYSLHLLFSKWRMFHSKNCFQGKSCDIIDKLEQCIEKLYSFHPLRTRISEEIVKMYLQMLTHIVNMKLDGIDYTLEMLLWDIDFRNEEEVILCIRENLDLYEQSFSKMKLLMDSAVDQRKSPSGKTELTEIFLAAYEKLPPFTQGALLKVFLAEHQFSQILKLPSYEKGFAFVFHQGSDLDELTRLIYPLAIQSPYKTIDKIVSNAIKYGPKFCCSAQLLKKLEVVSTFQAKAHKPVIQRLLVNYCFLNYDDANRENLLALSHQILKEFKCSAFPIAAFMDEVVLRHIGANLTGKGLEFALQLLNLCVSHTFDEDDSEWVTNFPLHAIVLLLCQIISFSIISLKGCLKEQVVASLENVFKLEKFAPIAYDKLYHHLSEIHPVAQFYLWDHLPFKDTDFSTWNLEATLYWWIIHRERDPDLIIKCISQKCGINSMTQITMALLQIVPHFTTAEFGHLPHLFIAPFFHSNVKDDYDSLELGENEDIWTKKLQVVSLTEVLVDVFVLLNNASEPRLDWNHMLNAFMNMTTDCLHSFPTCPLISTRVFLEFCRLVSTMPNHVDILSMILHDILKDLISDEGISSDKDICKRLLQSAVCSLPNNVKQADLLSLL